MLVLGLMFSYVLFWAHRLPKTKRKDLKRYLLKCNGHDLKFLTKLVEGNGNVFFYSYSFRSNIICTLLHPKACNRDHRTPFDKWSWSFVSGNISAWELLVFLIGSSLYGGRGEWAKCSLVRESRILEFQVFKRVLLLFTASVHVVRAWVYALFINALPNKLGSTTC